MIKMNLQFFATEGDYVYETYVDGTSIIREYLGDDEDVDIPDTLGGVEVTMIDPSAFADKQLKSVGIPKSIRYIGHFAFANNQLTSVTISENMYSIDPEAFYGNNISEVFIQGRDVYLWNNIFGGNQDDSSNLVIYGYPDSTAEQYALGHGHTFESLLIKLKYFDRNEWQEALTTKQIKEHEDNLSLHPRETISYDLPPVGEGNHGDVWYHVPHHDNSNAPGNKRLLAGDMQAGFFGEVSASELLDGEALCSAIGLTVGEPYFSDEPFLKFAWKGKILFINKKPIRHSITWNAIADIGAVYGDGSEQGNAKVSINNLDYKVRLMRGASSDPFTEAGGEDNEWDNLFYPISNISDNGWGFDYTVHDLLGVVGTISMRLFTYCQETDASQNSNCLIRGGTAGGFTGFVTIPKDSSTDSRCARFVLELIQD